MTPACERCHQPITRGNDPRFCGAACRSKDQRERERASRARALDLLRGLTRAVAPYTADDPGLSELASQARGFVAATAATSRR